MNISMTNRSTSSSIIENENLLAEYESPSSSNSLLQILQKFTIKTSEFLIKISIAVSVIIFLSLMVLYDFGYYNKEDNTHIPGAVKFSNSIYPAKDGAVILLGDSLINEPCTNYNLIGKLQMSYNYSFGYTNCGANGNRIEDILNRLPELITNIQQITNQSSNLNFKFNINSTRYNINSPIMLILLWDSDISDIFEWTYTPSHKRLLRLNYKLHLQTVIQELLNTGVYISIAGPGLLPWYLNKKTMLEVYKQINIEVATSFNIEYIDLREAYLIARGKGHQPTVFGDGEHPNNYGTKIMSQMFSNSIIRWKALQNNYRNENNSSSYSIDLISNIPTIIPTTTTIVDK
eukprot:gene8742-18071_t